MSFTISNNVKPWLLIVDFAVLFKINCRMFGCIPLCCTSYGSTEDIVIQSHSEIKLQQFNIAESHGLTEQAPVALRAYEAIQQMTDCETY